MNMVRSMLKGNHLLERIIGRNSVHNHIFVELVSNKEVKKYHIEESWSGFKPSMSHFRVFGSVSYRHVPNQLRKNIDNKGNQMILVRYHSTGGYKLYDIVNKRIIINMNMIFDEVRGWQQVVTDYQPTTIYYHNDEVVLKVIGGP